MFRKHYYSNSIESGTNWLSISDLMAGLMIVFMFISIVSTLALTGGAQELHDNKKMIYKALKSKFKNELKEWDAEIQPDLTIRFNEPSVFFKTGSDKISKEFNIILSVFIPSYFEVLSDYKKDIEEVRIEGHTSSAWEGSKSKQEAYLKNMDLSQKRTRAVLKEIFDILDVDQLEWAFKHITANGMSSSNVIFQENGKEDIAKSKRVEFKVKLKKDAQFDKLLKKRHGN